MHNDRLNRCDQGRKNTAGAILLRPLQKKTNTIFLNINFDKHGFNAETGIGNRFHAYYLPPKSPSQYRSKNGIKRGR